MLTTMDEFFINRMRQVFREEMQEIERNRHKIDPPDTLYNRNQVARFLKKSFTTVNRMVKEGRITPTADGCYITRKEIDRYLNSK